MREILFRGKTTVTGNWICGCLGRNTSTDAPQILPEGHCSYSLVIPETVGQFTGLTDCNGKKIFEGDIVKLFYKDGFEVGLIGWSNIDVRYKFASPDGTAYGFDVTDTFEVIGNIHDNPELLKGGDE